jgi:hypothetical protein
VHLMGLALVVPLGLHMIAVRRRLVWADRTSVAAIVLVAVVAAWPYWRLLVSHGGPTLAGTVSLDGLLLPLRSGRLLSARHLDYFFGPGPVADRTLDIAAGLSAIADILVWAGIALASWSVWRAARTREWTPRENIAVVLLGSLICQAIIGGLTGKFEHPQYSNATWIAATLLAWFAVDVLATRRSWIRRVGVAATGLLAAALLVATTTVGARVHRTHGTREVYGPTIENQQRVARTIAQYSPAVPIETHVSLYERYPHVLAVLRELNPATGENRPAGNLSVRYASDDRAFGAIQVIAR